MIRRLILGAGVAVVLAACGRRSDVASSDRDSTIVESRGPTAATLLRLPRDGGPARAYRAPDLAPLSWKSDNSFPAIAALVGADPDQQQVFVLDRKRNLVGLDLATGRVRSTLPQIERAAIGPDGTVYAVDTGLAVTRLVRRSPVRFRDRLTAQPTELFTTIGGDLIARHPGAAGLEILGADHPRRQVKLPAGPTTATQWGDLVAVGTDTGVVLYATSGKTDQPSVAGKPVGALRFSPSGHRLYAVLRDQPVLRVLDRFGRDEIGRIALPAPAAELRGDRFGDWLLVRAAHGDSVWVVDLTANRVVAGIATRWAADLPAVLAPHTLLARRGDAVVAIDFTAAKPAETGRIAGGAKDLWIPVIWQPVGSEQPELPRLDSSTPAVAAGGARDSTVPGDTTARRPGPGERVYLQISSSQNPDWARDLRTQLRQAGLPASVLDPHQAGDPYRVVLGPYESRDEAAEASRKLGRPSFIIAAEPRDSTGR